MAHSYAEWKGGMAFDLDLQDRKIPVDAVEEFGGKGYGPQPKGLMLSALAGCTAMDVVSLLGKMKVPFDSFKVDIDAELADTHPKVFTYVTVKYLFTGNEEELVQKKILRSIDLSLNDYCGVAATMKHTAEISWELIINGETVATGKQGQETG
jgi:putative redox protein